MKKALLENRRAVFIAHFFLIIFIVLIFALRFVHLEADVPFGITWSSEIYGDEGLYTRNAVAKTITGNWLIPDESNPIVIMPIFQYIVYISFRLFGISLTSARIPGVLFFGVALFFLYALLREYCSRLLGLLTIGLVACNYLFFVYSRLALNENLVIMLSFISIYLAQKYNRHGSLVILLPFVVFAAILTKISAIVVWIPIIFLVLYEKNGYTITSRKVRNLVVSLIIFLFSCICYWLFIVHPYSEYGDYYLAIVPVFPDSMEGLASVFYGIWKIFRNGYLISHVIFSVGYIMGMIGILIMPFTRFYKKYNIVGALALWVIFYLIAGGIGGGGYNPPRYYLLTIIPLITIMVLSAERINKMNFQKSRLIKVVTTALLLIYAFANTGQIIKYVVRPDFSFTIMARYIRKSMGENFQKRALVTDVIDTISLGCGILVFNIETGPKDKLKKIKVYKPEFLLTLGQLSDKQSNLEKVTRYADIALQAKYDVFENYHNGKPVFFYKLRLHNTP